MFDCKFLMDEVYSNVYCLVFKWLSIIGRERSDKYETALVFDERKHSFMDAKSPLAYRLILLKENDVN